MGENDFLIYHFSSVRYICNLVLRCVHNSQLTESESIHCFHFDISSSMQPAFFETLTTLVWLSNQVLSNWSIHGSHNNVCINRSIWLWMEISPCVTWMRSWINWSEIHAEVCWPIERRVHRLLFISVLSVLHSSDLRMFFSHEVPHIRLAADISYSSIYQ